MGIMNVPDREQQCRQITPRKRKITRWQALFPFHWDADEFVTRRDMLRLTVMASGALFAATASIVALGFLRPQRGEKQMRKIVAAAEVPRGGVHYFSYPNPEDQAILLRLSNGQFVAYSGRCTHLSCAVYYHEEKQKLLCPCHEGVFDPITGEPVAGPPQRPLPKIAIRQDGSMLYAEEVRPQ
jgi:Rieske Fe-S protein